MGNLIMSQIQEIPQMYLAAELFIIIAIVIVGYILESFAIMKMAKKCNIKNSWLAFVLAIRKYIIAKVAFEDSNKAISLFFLNFISLIYTILSTSFSSGLLINYSPGISTLNTILLIVNWVAKVFLFYAYYKIYKKYSNKAVVMIVCSILSCGLLNSFFVFAIRNNELKEPAKQ